MGSFFEAMKYAELKVETQRQAPAHVRTEAESLLRRAGYISRDGAATPLGQRTFARLQELSRQQTPAELFKLLQLTTVSSEDGAFFFPSPTGRSNLLQCPACGYAARQETARFKKTPETEQTAEPLERVETPECHAIEALASFLSVPRQQTAKALMFTRPSDDRFVFVVIRGDMQLSDAKLKQHVGDVRLATPAEIAAGGAAPGYASPIGLSKEVLVVVDELIPVSANLVAGANQPGYHLKNTNYGRDYSADMVADIVLAAPGAPCPNCSTPLSLVQAELLADLEGLCLAPILESIADSQHDEKGLTLPPGIAPFDVYLLCLPGKEMDTRARAEQLNDEWQSSGLSVLFDDREERAGVKFADADLMGCPVRATVGERGMKDGMVELKARKRGELASVPFEQAIAAIKTLITP